MTETETEVVVEGGEGTRLWVCGGDSEGLVCKALAVAGVWGV